MVEAAAHDSQESSEERFILLVLQKTLKMLGEPPCRTLQEGQQFMIDLVKRGVYSQDLLEELVDQAIDSVQSMSQYKLIFSDSNSSSLKVPKNGVLKLGSENSNGSYHPESDRPMMSKSDLLSREQQRRV